MKPKWTLNKELIKFVKRIKKHKDFEDDKHLCDHLTWILNGTCTNYYFFDDKTPICGYAQCNFGGFHYCLSPKGCWQDVKIKKRFDEEKHCPNCSKPNKPFKLIKDKKGLCELKCIKCNYMVN